jgi:hypothetical protein
MTTNRFKALEEQAVEIEIGHVSREINVSCIDIERPKGINEVGRKRTGKYVSAGKGKITVDSGAGESVMPKGLLPGEEMVEGHQKKNGVNYIAANGNKMENYGEKKVRFKHGEDSVMNSIVLQATDVRKPLAAVSRILDKGNRVVFSRSGSYIQHEKSGKKIELKEENVVFALEVEFFEPEAEASVEQSFTRQGN